MIYKTFQKVSDVCQLLDKSKYPATQTNNGVTFINNGDGTITANGTSTKDFAEYHILRIPKPPIGHKILVLPSTNPTIQNHIYIYAGNTNGVWIDDLGHGGRIITITEITSRLKKTYTTINISINVNKGWTMNNHIYKPQLFDLTEMYGAGNEPTSVEEFRSKFSNDLYDYSPNCFITSYKNCLTCKTKNLFDYTKVSGLRNTSTGADISSRLIINGASFTVKYAGYAGPAHIFPLFILKAGTYTLSLIAKGTVPGNTGHFGIVKFNSDGTKTHFSGRWASSDIRQSYTFTLDEDSEVALDLQGDGNASNYLFLDSTFSNIQLELGDTATDYVPYGHLTSYKKSLICTTKNLLNPKMCDIYQEVAYGLNIEYTDNNQTVHIYGTSTVTTGSASFNVIKTSDKSIYNKGYKIKIFNLAGKNPPVFKDIYGLRKTDTVGQIAIMIEITKGVYYDFSFKIMVSEQTATEYHPYGYL